MQTLNWNAFRHYRVTWLFFGLGVLSAAVSATIDLTIEKGLLSSELWKKLPPYWIPIMFGIAITMAGRLAQLEPHNARLARFLLIQVASYVGFRCAIIVSSPLGGPFPWSATDFIAFSLAGAVGAFIVAVPLLLVWTLRDVRRLTFIALNVSAGLIGGLIFWALAFAGGVHGNSNIARSIAAYGSWQGLVLAAMSVAAYNRDSGSSHLTT